MFDVNRTRKEIAEALVKRDRSTRDGRFRFFENIKGHINDACSSVKAVRKEFVLETFELNAATQQRKPRLPSHRPLIPGLLGPARLMRSAAQEIRHLRIVGQRDLDKQFRLDNSPCTRNLDATRASLSQSINKAAIRDGEKVIQAKPREWLFDDNEVFAVARHCLEVPGLVDLKNNSLRDFVEGLAQRYEYVNEAHVDGLSDMFDAYVTWKDFEQSASEAKMKAQATRYKLPNCGTISNSTACVETSAETAHANALSENAARVKKRVLCIASRAANSIRAELERYVEETSVAGELCAVRVQQSKQMTSTAALRIIENGYGAQERRLIRKETVNKESWAMKKGDRRPFAESPSGSPTAENQKKHAHSSKGRRDLRRAALQVPSDNSFVEQKSDFLWSSPSNSDCTSRTPFKDSPERTTQLDEILDDAVEFLKHLDYKDTSGHDLLPDLLRETEYGQRALEGCFLGKNSVKLHTELQRILYLVSASGTMSHNAFRKYLYAPIEKLLRTLAVERLPAHPLGTLKSYDLMNLPLQTDGK